jgi:hypothetical protein
VKTENPNACATVNWKVCKSAIALCYVYLSITKCECVTQLLIYLIIRIRTRPLSGVYHPTRHSIYSAVTQYEHRIVD